MGGCCTNEGVSVLSFPALLYRVVCYLKCVWCAHVQALHLSWKTSNSIIWSFVHLASLHYLVEYCLEKLGHFWSSIFPVHFLWAIFRLFVIVSMDIEAVHNFRFSILIHCEIVLKCKVLRILDYSIVVTDLVKDFVIHMIC